ncbi:hypothetical protein AMS58_14100 [Pseudoalteromonas porphyrae]|uniref:DUF4920 domain-containing protein n=1 Tax=Pseudoalteromonas porphyrae TaxID=187330 RepID=A0A0N1MRT5_9GAMM|nr:MULTISPECIES: DUF4920 domain-containing protein [Pseudoalteromonas]KPH59135.1 hypothetical protein ADS77_17350 [Pseudoalteromonas porphyrae]KPH94085.1 hypothetical protein AMS58_14100 [Pseudoalteromonas porphyrae]
MKIWIEKAKTIFCAVLLFSGFAFNVSAGTLHFGGEVNAGNITKISTIMNDPDDYLATPVTIEGTIVGVCEKRGCWMSLASDQRFQNLRIKVNDGDMVFPMTAKGRKAIATGELKKIELTLERTKTVMAHRAQKAGDDFDPSSVTEPMAIYQLNPSAVDILE